MLKLDQASGGKEKNKKFKDIVQKVMCKLKLEKMLHYTEEMKQLKLGNVTAMMAVNDEFLRRSLGYRKNVDHLNRDVLILRQTQGEFPIDIKTKIRYLLIFRYLNFIR